jgi:hypothetical protein
MSDFKNELLTLLEQHKESFTDYIVTLSGPPIPGAVAIPEVDLRQMVGGFFMLVREGIEGKGRELRDMYVSVVFPGLRDSGADASSIVGGTARVLLHIYAELLSRVSADHRKQAQELLNQFFSEYVGEMAAVWAVSR